jgi:hypothetical protein
MPLEGNQSMSLAAPTHAVADITRPCVNFRPSIWGDIFLQYDLESLVLYLYMQNILPHIYIFLSYSLVLEILHSR